MYVQRYIVARSRNHSHGNARIRYRFIVVGTDAVVNNVKCSVLKWKCNNAFPLQWYRVTKYFVLLLRIISIRYYDCVF